MQHDDTLEFFTYEHLPVHLQDVSRPFCNLAQHMVQALPDNAQRAYALQYLLLSKDAAVRALIAGTRTVTNEPSTTSPSVPEPAPASDEDAALAVTSPAGHEEQR